jgi:hypothetical protein
MIMLLPSRRSTMYSPLRLRYFVPDLKVHGPGSPFTCSLVPYSKQRELLSDSFLQPRKLGELSGQVDLQARIFPSNGSPS